MRRNTERCLGALVVWLAMVSLCAAQGYYQPNEYYGNPYYGNQAVTHDPRNLQTYDRTALGYPSAADYDYDSRDAERILWDQMNRSYYQPEVEPQNPAYHPDVQAYSPGYHHNQGADYGSPYNAYGHRLSNEEQVAQVMAEARRIAGLIHRNLNGKAFFIVDKRNFQFYLFDRDANLLRIGPVAIGKGPTAHGAFETHVGVYPISSKEPVADWIRPDWYYKEEGLPIPKNWEERRVKGFFRYKMVFHGMKYIHYAEATGGRLTHGCLGLDWEDAQAVFHTLEVGSYCIVVDDGMLTRLARGEFPIKRRAKAENKKPEKKEVDEKPTTITARADIDRGSEESKPFGNSMW